MDVEIWLDVGEASPENQEQIKKRFMEWYSEGSEVRHNKKSFNSLNIVDAANHRYAVDLGYADLITAFKNLHARLHRLGVKVFIHFLP